MNLIGTLLSNRYLVQSYIDEGGMSVIFKAVDIANNNAVALKVLKPEFSSDEEFTKRFFNEAKASYNVSHANIVALLDADEDNGIFYLAFEYVQGETLKRHIAQHAPLSAETTAKIATQVLWALKHAHAKNIIHRDIKAQNVILDTQGNAKVLDFGIARVPNSQTITNTNEALGTLHYVSPEQASGKDVTLASDIYSVGVLMYEMLTGTLPFDGEDMIIILSKQIHENPKPLKSYGLSIPNAMDTIVQAALQKNPLYRYKNAGEMIDDLTKFLQGDAPKIALELLEKQKNKPSYQPVNQVAIAKTKNTVKKHYKLFLWTIPIFLVVLTLVLFWGVMWLSSLTQVVYVPDVQGLDYARAMDVLYHAELTPSVKYTYNNKVDENIVFSQLPLPQEKMKKKDTVFIEVSRGRQADTVPDLTNMPLSAAYEKATKLNFTLSVVEKVVDEHVEEGIIITQLTPAGELFSSDRIVQVIVSGGMAKVPSLKKLSQSEALQKITKAKLQLGTLTFENVEDKSLYGKVIRQTPDAHSAVIINSKVNLVIGNAPILFTAQVSIDPQYLVLNAPLKITVLENNEEIEKYIQIIETIKPEKLIIPIQSFLPGETFAKIYINDKLQNTVKVNFE